MVQFLSIIFFVGFIQFLLGFFKSSRFFCVSLYFTWQCLTGRCEHVVCEMTFVIFPVVVLSRERPVRCATCCEPCLCRPRCEDWRNGSCAEFRGGWDYSAGTTILAWLTQTDHTRPPAIPNLTPQRKSLRNTGICGARRIWTASIVTPRVTSDSANEFFG